MVNGTIRMEIALGVIRIKKKGDKKDDDKGRESQKILKERCQTTNQR